MLSKYSAESIDEVSCSRGDLVQLLSVNHVSNRVLIYKPPCNNNPGQEGWISGVPLGLAGTGQDGRYHDPSLSTTTHYLSAGDEEKSEKKMKLKLIRRRSRSPHSKPTNSWQQKLSFKITALSNSMMEPSFNYEPDSITVKVGEEALLECHVSGKPKPNIFWKTPDGNIALPDERIEWMESDYGHYAFSLKYPVLTDTGSYTCLAVSEMGEVERSALIDVIDTADPPGKPSVVKTEGGTVILSWESPVFDGHSPIEGYAIDSSHSESPEWQELVSYVKENTQMIEQKKLAAGLMHFFRVRTYNSAGVSLPGPVSDPLLIPLDDKEEKSVEVTSPTDWKAHFEDLHVKYSTISSFPGGDLGCWKKIIDGKTILAKYFNSAERAATEKDIFTHRKHPNILQATEYYRTEPDHYLVLPNIQLTLLEWVCRDEMVGEVDLVLYTRQLMKAVQYLQELNFLHLNILPETVLVTEDRIVKLSGFEKAVFIDENMETTTSEHKPTDIYNDNLEFQPVEIASGGEITAATDIWSLGVFTYLMLCGVTPFYDKDPVIIKQNIQQVNLPLSAELFPHVSECCLTLLKVMFIRNPRMRPLADRCLLCSWLNVLPDEDNMLCTVKLSKYLTDRKSDPQEQALPS